jgi:hypothetical protein
MIAVSPVLGDLPTYTGFQLQARASFDNGFNLPIGSQFPNSVPALNDAGDVAFTFVDDNLDDNIWQGGNGSGAPISQPFLYASDPSLNADGDVAWRVSSISGNVNDGVWRAVDGVPAKLTMLPTGATYWGNPIINDRGLVMYRASVFGSDQHVVYDHDAGTVTPIASEGAAFYFLATPAFNNANQIASEAWDATLGNQIQLRRWELDGSSVILLDDTGPYREFLNSLDMNDLGQLAVQAMLDTSGAEIIRVDDAGVRVIASSGAGGDFASLVQWGPAINNAGVVAFRGTRNGETEGVYIGDGENVMRVVGVNDTVETDLGRAQITGISASIDINDRGDVAFNAALTRVGGTSIGRGIFVALAAPAGCAGDSNCDGEITWRDIDYFVAAQNDNVAGWEALFAPGTPSCPFANNDVNGDETVNWRDIDPLVALMNTTCP